MMQSRAGGIIVEQILETHPGNEQEVQVDRSAPPLTTPPRLLPFFLLRRLWRPPYVRCGEVLPYLVFGFFVQRPGLVKLLEEVIQIEPLRPLERVIVFKRAMSHHEVEKNSSRRVRVRNGVTSVVNCRHPRKRGTGDNC